jgi:hypothetical protein
MGFRNLPVLRPFSNFFSVFALSAAVLSSAGCAAKNQTAGNPSGLTMDEALMGAAANMMAEIAAGTKVAILSYASPSECLSEYVVRELEANIVETGKVTVVDRKELDLIRSEMDFQYSSEVRNESAQDLGRKLGAQVIITGSHTELAGTHRVLVRALVVESAVVTAQYRNTVVSDAVITALMKNCDKSQAAPTAAAGGGSPAKAAEPVQVAQAGAVPAQPAAPAKAALPSPDGPFNIGDMGPAGGIIFFDKGSFSDGWRYLEAAPADLNRQYPVSTEDFDAKDCFERGLGWGKKNTAEVMKIAMTKGGGFGWAAHATVNYSVNGFKDWFIPSRDELNFMYGNLHLNGKGNFRNDTYWSSTAFQLHGWGHRFMPQNFANGKQLDYNEGNFQNLHRIRPIRQF